MSSQRWLGLGLLVLVFSSASWVAAQPPRKEEEEDTKEKARPAVPVPVAESDKKDAPPPADSGDPDVGTFREELAKATSPAAKEMFRALLVPFDRIQSTFGTNGTTFRIELLPARELPEEEFEVKVLDASLKNSVAKKMSTGSGFTYTPFELVVLEQVNSFLARTESMEKSEQLDYASRAVAAGLRWHLLAVNNNKRVGKAWDAVTSSLKYRLRDLMRERFQHLLDLKKYDRADEVGLKMLGRFPNDTEVLRDVYRLQLLQSDLKSGGSDADLARLRESVLLYERLPGKKDEGLIRNARRKLRDRAATLLALAKDDDKQKMTSAALAKLRTAETLDPDLPGIEDVRKRLRGTVLYVGVPKLPEMMSPAAATTDSERWAIELIFEGLLQVVPDTDVVRYRPELAEALPGVMPLGRSFTLPRNIRWGRDGGDVLDARDVRGTLELMREPGFRERWCYDGLDVFQSIDRLDDPFRLRLAYDRGVLEPLSRATFKVIPARYLRSQGWNDEAAQRFARAPFGSGPFRYEGREREGADRECAVFRMNPFYGQRAGKFGLPWIREIRFYVPTQSTLGKDVPAGQLHLYPDAPSELIPRFRTENGLKDLMRVHTATTNRRVHILAINHRQTALQNDKVRQGLSAAINRDAILKEVFRGGHDEKVHQALTGPFPVRSWATAQAAREAPLYKPGAGGLFTEGLAGRGTIKLGLLYDADDPKNAVVCQRIKTQVEEASAGKDGKPTVQIELQGAAGDRFYDALHLEHRYDLALATFDYRDDLYSLAGLLDPDATGRGGRNFLGYLASGTNPGEADRRLRRTIDEVRSHRDFTARVRDLTWDLHTLFNQRVPFVPLWQLDRFMVVHKDVKLHFDNPSVEVSPERLDPAVIFTGVEMWRVE